MRPVARTMVLLAGTALACCTTPQYSGQTMMGQGYPGAGSAALLGRLAAAGRTAMVGVLGGTVPGGAGNAPNAQAAWADHDAGTSPATPQAHAALFAQPAGVQPPAPGNQAAGAPVSPSVQKSVCTSRQIQHAMQNVEMQAAEDPAGRSLGVLAAVFTGIDANSGGMSILASKVGNDGGRYTSKVPGSFICRGLFERIDAHASAENPANPEASLTSGAANGLAAARPNFVEFFLVAPLQPATYKLTLLPSSLQLSRTYSADFTVADNK